MTQTLAVASSPALDRAALLADCERRIVESQRTFMAALYDIYSQQLWADTDTSFDAYLMRRWGYKDRYCRYLRGAMLNIEGVRTALNQLSAVEMEVALPGVDEDVEVDPVELSPVWDTAFIEDEASGTAVPEVVTTNTVPDIASAPEGVTRPLSALATNEQKAEAWVRATSAAGGAMPTSAQVGAAVSEVIADSQLAKDRRFVERYAGQYPYILEAVDGDTMRLADAALLVDTLNSIATRVRNVAVKARLTDLTLIRELSRISSRDTFDEIEASGGLDLRDGFVPLHAATAVHLRTLLDQRQQMHKTLAREAAHDLEVFKADVVEIGTEVETWAGSQTEVVFVTMIMPKAVADKLATEKRYSFTVEVPKQR